MPVLAQGGGGICASASPQEGCTVVVFSTTKCSAMFPSSPIGGVSCVCIRQLGGGRG